MARPPRFNISVLADLLKQLRYAPDETIARQMRAAERLLDQIEPDRNYPEDFIVYRIIGFRTRIDSPAIFIGQALVGDLARFIEQLSARLAWPMDRYADRPILTAQQVRQRLGVSAVTLHRYRKKGLVAYRAVEDDGRSTLVFLESAIQRFEERNAQRVVRAKQFSRLSGQVRQSIVDEARRLRGEQPITLNAAAAQIARRIGRSHDAVRRVLLKFDREHPQDAIFNETGPLTLRQRRFLLRAFDRGLPTTDLAARVGRSSSTVYRAIAEERAQRLRTWTWRYARLATFDHADADEVILGVQCVRSGLPITLATDPFLARWIDPALDSRPATIEKDVPRHIAALNLLLYRADALRATLPTRQPAASVIDEIETNLRWATRLKRRLLEHLRGALRTTLEVHLNRRLGEAPSREIVSLYVLAMQCAMRVIDEFDPDRQPDLIAVAVHALRSALARRADVLSHLTARSRSDPATIELPDLQSQLAPWVGVLEWVQRRPERVDSLSPRSVRIVTARLGLDGQAPRTQVQIAGELGSPVHRIVNAEQRARRTLRRMQRP